MNILLQFKITVFYFNILANVIYSSDGWIFSSHHSSLQCHTILQKLYYYWLYHRCRFWSTDCILAWKFSKNVNTIFFTLSLCSFPSIFSEQMEDFSNDLFNSFFDDHLLAERNPLLDMDLDPPNPDIQAEHSYSLSGDSAPQSPSMPIQSDWWCRLASSSSHSSSYMSSITQKISCLC